MIMLRNIIVEYNQIIQNTFLYYFSEQIKYSRILFLLRPREVDEDNVRRSTNVTVNPKFQTRAYAEATTDDADRSIRLHQTMLTTWYALSRVLRLFLPVERRFVTVPVSPAAHFSAAPVYSYSSSTF